MLIAMSEGSKSSSGPAQQVSAIDSAGVTWAGDFDSEADASGAANPEPERSGLWSQPEQIARFVVLERLGAGAMGVVHAAWDPDLDRRVALKLVRPGRGSGNAHARLLREAQAMAKLSHPNVVSVYEVGSYRGAVWIGMEFVDGLTLGDWLEREQPSWMVILDMFRQAGEGLAAAHEVGLVHRDFKPDNVLIGSDGRPRVADFGLVRPVEREASNPTDTPIDPAANTIARLEQGQERSDLTRAGAMVGTPLYMAPEQFLNEDADARADQFAFCVALYEALYGQRPFAGTKVTELAASVMLGDPALPPRESPVPAAIGQAILRGLARERDERFADMPALLAALKVEPPKRRWPWVLGGASLLTAALVLGLELGDDSSPAPDVCASGVERAAASWNEAHARQIEQRFSSHGLSFASNSFALVEKGLGTWSQAWGASYRQACETRHEQSAELYDLRMACLARQRVQIDALVELLVEADADLVRETPLILAGLPTPEACADVELLRAIPPPAPEQADAVRTMRDARTRLQLRVDAGDFVASADELATLRAEADALGYEPLIAEVASSQALVSSLVGKRDEALAHNLDAYALALAHGDDTLALRTANRLITVDDQGRDREGLEFARRWHLAAVSLSRRLDEPPKLVIHRQIAFGRALARHLEFEAARAEFEGASAVAEATYGVDTFTTARANVQLALMLVEGGHYHEAKRLLDRTLATYVEVLGAEHPLAAAPRFVSYRLNVGLGQLDAALVDAQILIDIDEATYGAGHPHAAESSLILGTVLMLRGEHERARERFEGVLETLDERSDVRSSVGASATTRLCRTLDALGEAQLATEACERARVGVERVYWPEHPARAEVLDNLALLARRRGDCEAGVELGREALAIREALLGPEHPDLTASLIEIGACSFELGRREAALDVLRRAVDIRAGVGPGPALDEARAWLQRARDE